MRQGGLYCVNLQKMCANTIMQSTERTVASKYGKISVNPLVENF